MLIIPNIAYKYIHTNNNDKTVAPASPAIFPKATNLAPFSSTIFS